MNWLLPGIRLLEAVSTIDQARVFWLPPHRLTGGGGVCGETR